MLAEMKFFIFIAIATLLVHQHVVACSNRSVNLPPNNGTLAVTEKSLSCTEMQECIKACISSTANADNEEKTVFQDKVNVTVAECG